MIVIDYTDKRPLYEQIIERIQSLVLRGILEKDAGLPSVRSLAMDLSINPNTIQRAYSELEHRGVIYTVKGKGNFVADLSSLMRLQKTEFMKEGRALVKRAKETGMTKGIFLSHMTELWDEHVTMPELDPEQVTRPELLAEHVIKPEGVEKSGDPFDLGGEVHD